MSSTPQFGGKVIALTGAASGIGLETAHLLASRGAKLSLADVQKEALENVKKDIETKYKTEVLVFPLDVRKYDQVEAWINGTVQQFGKLDGAANLAGVIPKTIGLGAGALVDQDFADWDFVMGVNSTGVMHCLRAQLKVMADNGSVVNASSIAGTTGRENNASYSASKHAVLGLTRSAAKEVGVRGIRVNAICPGRIGTPMGYKAHEIMNNGDPASYDNLVLNDVALKRVGKPKEVAQLIAFLLSDESTYVTGTDIAVDGGWRC